MWDLPHCLQYSWYCLSGSHTHLQNNLSCTGKFRTHMCHGLGLTYNQYLYTVYDLSRVCKQMVAENLALWGAVSQHKCEENPFYSFISHVGKKPKSSKLSQCVIYWEKECHTWKWILESTRKKKNWLPNHSYRVVLQKSINVVCTKICSHDYLQILLLVLLTLVYQPKPSLKKQTSPKY